MFIHDNGVENVAVAMVKHTRHDYIVGGKILYRVFKRIPEWDELYNSEKYFKRLTSKDRENIRWMHDAESFVVDDPYNFFGDVGTDTIINEWRNASIEEYYKPFYVKTGSELYHFMGKDVDLNKLTNEEIKQYIPPIDAMNFIEARNYIRKAINSDAKMAEWHRLAHDRHMRKYGPKKGRAAAIKESKYMTERRKIRMENIKKVKELHKKGWNTRAIANEIGISNCTVFNYLKS